MPSSDTQFKSGIDARRNTKGGTKSPRTQIIERLDKLCKKAKNVKAIDAALQFAFDKDPFHFWLTVIVPLAPKQRTEAELAEAAEKAALAAEGKGDWAEKSPAEIAQEMTKATLGTPDE